jgi:hypothetical protein
MKRFLIIVFVLFPLLLSAQTQSSGMTPYVFQKVWDYVTQNKINNAEALLKKRGYRKVGDYNRTIGFNKIYVKDCTVTVSNDGTVKSSRATTRSGYASYFEIGAGIGLCYDISVTFLSRTGTNAFIKLLKKSNYRFSRKDLYDWEKIDNVWQRSKDGWFLLQQHNTFYLNEGPCA